MSNQSRIPLNVIKNVIKTFYVHNKTWEEIDFEVLKMSPCYDTVPIGVMVKNNF